MRNYDVCYVVRRPGMALGPLVLRLQAEGEADAVRQVRRMFSPDKVEIVWVERVLDPGKRRKK